MPGKLAGKVAIITGAGGGYGEGIAKKFTEEGAKVVLIDIVADNIARVTAELPSGAAVGIQGDVSKEPSWQAAFDEAIKNFGKVDIVVNNAGVVNGARAAIDVSEADIDRMINVNLKSLYQSAKVVVPHLRQRGEGGAFVNVSSMASLRPRPNLVWYSASKGAVSAATKALAAELAKDRIRCNTICPAAGDTAMLRLSAPENRAQILGEILLGRFATPADIGNAASFLASDEASLITGVELPVDGGRALN